MESFPTDVADMVLGSIWIVPQLVVIVEEPLVAHDVLAFRAFVHARVVRMIPFVQH